MIMIRAFSHMNLEMLFWSAVLAVLVGTLFYVLRRTRSGRNAALRPDTPCPEGKGLYPECLFVVRIFDGDVSVKAPDGAETRISLAQVGEIAVETNDSGPGGADVWWRFFDADGRAICRFPGGATGESAALRVFQTLPGFDNDALIEAMGSTSNRRFVVYRGA